MSKQSIVKSSLKNSPFQKHLKAPFTTSSLLIEKNVGNLDSKKSSKKSMNFSSSNKSQSIIKLRTLFDIENEIKDNFVRGDLKTKKALLSDLRFYIKNGSKEEFRKAHSILYENVDMIIDLMDFKTLSYLILSKDQIKKFNLRRDTANIYFKRSRTAFIAMADIIMKLGGEDVIDAVYRLANSVRRAPTPIKAEGFRSIRRVISTHPYKDIQKLMLHELIKMTRFYDSLTRKKAIEYTLRVASDKRISESENAKRHLINLFTLFDNSNKKLLNNIISIYESKNPAFDNLKEISLDLLKSISTNEFVDPNLRKEAKKAIERNSSLFKRITTKVYSVLSPLLPKALDYGLKLLVKKETWIFLRNFLMRFIPL